MIATKPSTLKGGGKCSSEAQRHRCHPGSYSGTQRQEENFAKFQGRESNPTEESKQTENMAVSAKPLMQRTPTNMRQNLLLIWKETPGYTQNSLEMEEVESGSASEGQMAVGGGHSWREVSDTLVQV